jgi:hypothetical protein
MSTMRRDHPPFRLDPVSYENLRQQVLRRDGWRCQSCGTMSNLEVHHKQFRSQSGEDSDENLISALYWMPQSYSQRSNYTLRRYWSQVSW